MNPVNATFGSIQIYKEPGIKRKGEKEPAKLAIVLSPFDGDNRVTYSDDVIQDKVLGEHPNAGPPRGVVHRLHTMTYLKNLSRGFHYDQDKTDRNKYIDSAFSMRVREALLQLTSQAGRRDFNTYMTEGMRGEYKADHSKYESSQVLDLISENKDEFHVIRPNKIPENLKAKFNVPKVGESVIMVWG